MGGPGMIGQGDRALQQHRQQAFVGSDRVDPGVLRPGEQVPGALPQAPAVRWRERRRKLVGKPGEQLGVPRRGDLDAGFVAERVRVAAEPAFPAAVVRVPVGQAVAEATADRQRLVMEGDARRGHESIMIGLAGGEQVHIGQGEHLVPLAPRRLAHPQLPLETGGDLTGVVEQGCVLHPGPETRFGGDQPGRADTVGDRASGVAYHGRMLGQQLRLAVRGAGRGLREHLVELAVTAGAVGPVRAGRPAHASDAVRAVRAMEPDRLAGALVAVSTANLLVPRRCRAPQEGAVFGAEPVGTHGFGEPDRHRLGRAVPVQRGQGMTDDGLACGVQHRPAGSAMQVDQVLGPAQPQPPGRATQRGLNPAAVRTRNPQDHTYTGEERPFPDGGTTLARADPAADRGVAPVRGNRMIGLQIGSLTGGAGRHPQPDRLLGPAGGRRQHPPHRRQSGHGKASGDPGKHRVAKRRDRREQLDPQRPDRVPGIGHRGHRAGSSNQASCCPERTRAANARSTVRG